MSKRKTQPARLRYVREILENGAELTEGHRLILMEVVDEALENRNPAISLTEFHKWIRLGEPILTAVEQELAQLRALTSSNGETISKAGLYAILEKYRNHKPKNEVDMGVNWVLDKIAREIETLLSV